VAFSKDIIAAVKERADIVEVIGERVSLKSNGSDYVGLCPFHGEKTPSFRVSPAWHTYHCFGCGVGGSVIDFVMAQERVSFPEAVRALAERFGVPLPEERGPREAGSRSGEVLQAAEGFYRELLRRRPEGERARIYLRERGFEEPDWDAFGLGWALDQWQGLMQHGMGKGFSHEDLLASGLVRKRQETGRMFDMLRKRVAIPIRDERGRTIAFGGRVIDPEDSPKYLNTPETRHYHKSRVLFGLSQGLEAIRRSKRAMLVEGYLDVMRLHQHGFAEAVATCGTSLTEEHLKLLGRNAERVLLVFDGDEAGVKAALRSAPLFLNSGLEARVVLLPQQLDPDDFLRRHAPEAFAALLADATPLLEFLVFQLAQRHGGSVAGRQQTLDALAPVLAEVRKEAARDLTVRYVADLVGVSPQAVLSLVRPARGGKDAPAAAPTLSQREGRHQRRVLRLLLEQRGLLPKARTLLRPEELSDPALRGLLERLLGFGDEEFAQLEPDTLMERVPELAPTVRALLLDDPLHGTAVAECGRQLENEVLCIKEELKDALFRKFKAVAGSPEEELALRRYLTVRDELVRLKSGFRSTHKPRPEVTLRPPPPAAS
jgi:DNA primase